MVVDWSDANKLHCAHTPEHATWVSNDGRSYAVCRMADRHLFNTINMLQRMELEETTLDETEVEDWLNILDKELSRRYANKVIDGKEQLDQLSETK